MRGLAVLQAWLSKIGLFPIDTQKGKVGSLLSKSPFLRSSQRLFQYRFICLPNRKLSISFHLKRQSYWTLSLPLLTRPIDRDLAIASTPYSSLLIDRSTTRMNIQLANDLTRRISSFRCTHPFHLPYLTTCSVLASPAATRIETLARLYSMHKELETALFYLLS